MRRESHQHKFLSLNVQYENSTEWATSSSESWRISQPVQAAVALSKRWLELFYSHNFLQWNWKWWQTNLQANIFKVLYNFIFFLSTQLWIIKVDFNFLSCSNAASTPFEWLNTLNLDISHISIRQQIKTVDDSKPNGRSQKRVLIRLHWTADKALRRHFWKRGRLT